jgi:phage I-like protein
MIGAGEYRYLSPVFPYAAGGEVLGLHSVALTNAPALDVLPEVALAAASLATLVAQEAPMDDLRERVLRLLSLPETTTDEALAADLDRVQAALAAATLADGTAAASLAAYLADAPARLAALAAQVAAAPAPALVAELQGQIAALTAAEAQRHKQAVLTAALSDGRLVAGTALYTHAAGLELPALEALAASLTPIAALAGTQTGGQPPAGAAGAFTAALAAEFGDEATYLAYQRAAAAGRVKHANNLTPEG